MGTPKIIIIFLLYTLTIDYENYSTFKTLGVDADHSNSQIHSDIPEEMRDFDYKITPLDSIANKKMPYINNNRKIFCNNSTFDLNNLLKLENSEFIENLLSNYDNIINRITTVVEIMNILDYENFAFPNDKLIAILDSEMKSNDEIQGFINRLNYQTDTLKLKNRAYGLLVEIENYIRLSSKVDLFTLFFRTRPSTLINDVFSNVYLNFENITDFISDTNYIYNQASINLLEINKVYQGIKGGKYNEAGSFVLRKNLLLRWMAEINVKRVIDLFDSFERYNVALIYSINTNDVIVKELTLIVRSICDGELNMELQLRGLKKISDQKKMYNVVEFDCYEFAASNSKKYIIRIFDLNKDDFLPPGISTAYLNCKNEFESYGYLGSFFNFKYNFISIEECTSFYISIDRSFGVFNNINESQVFHYILNFLKLLETLNAYRIKIKSPNLYLQLMIVILINGDFD